MSAELAVVAVGRMPYGPALALQRDLAQRRIDGAIDRDLLVLVEHPPVVTLGRGTNPAHLSTPREFLEAKGIEVFEIERGGDVTFHGPGQLVGYPIIALAEHKQDLHWYLRQVEQALIVGLDQVGIAGTRSPGFTGVWTEGRKIASIGVHVKRWVTSHGFALNVTTDLSYFDLIVPCGIEGVTMTSVQRELAERAPRDLWARVTENVILGFADTFTFRPQLVGVEDLERADAR
ncbi:MAG TPA: lipoyl(octanoyl) transferase LipB [Gemmatimonadales bacterium]